MAFIVDDTGAAFDTGKKRFINIYNQSKSDSFFSLNKKCVRNSL